MDNLNNLLLRRRDDQDPKIDKIKNYINANYNTDVRIRVSPKYYLITTKTAGIAQLLRQESLEIIDKCHLSKRLVIHIGY